MKFGVIILGKLAQLKYLATEWVVPDTYYGLFQTQYGLFQILTTCDILTQCPIWILEHLHAI